MTVAFIRTGSAAARPEHAAAREIASDEVLIRRIAGGDQLAMQTLFVRHRVALYRWLLRLVGDEALAEDLLSGALIEAGCALGAGKEVYLVAPWADWSLQHHPRVRCFETLEDAVTALVAIHRPAHSDSSS